MRFFLFLPFAFSPAAKMGVSKYSADERIAHLCLMMQTTNRSDRGTDERVSSPDTDPKLRMMTTTIFWTCELSLYCLVAGEMSAAAQMVCRGCGYGWRWCVSLFIRFSGCCFLAAAAGWSVR